MKRALGIAIAAFALATTTATAAARYDIPVPKLDVAVGPPDARFGEPHKATGRMRTDSGRALPGRRIALQVRPFPFTGAFRTVDHATTNSKGRFRFTGIELDRNADIRVRAFDGTTSGIARAFTYPAHELTYRVLDPRHVRFIQTYTVPRRVKLTRRTLFYVGPASERTARVKARARTVRVRRGRFRSSARITLPRSWHGRFHYASCFRYSPRSGMGDPAEGCPRRYGF